MPKKTKPVAKAPKMPMKPKDMDKMMKSKMPKKMGKC